MPPLEDMDRTEWCVLWRATGKDRYNEVTLDPPCQILVRWNKVKRLVRMADQSQQQIDADVLVDRDVGEGSVLWLGKLADFDADAVPKDNPLMQVVTRNETKDLKGLFINRTVQLARYHRTLPQTTT